MRKLLKKLNKWNLKRPIPIVLSKWQRDILFEFFSEHMDQVHKEFWFKQGRR